MLAAPLLLIQPALGAEAQCRAPAANSDPWHWYESDELREHGDCPLAAGCNGRYLAPLRDWDGAELPPALAPLYASADRSRVEGSLVTLEGDVVLHKGQLGLEAGRAEFDRESQRFSLTGGVTVTVPELVMRGDSADLSGADGTGRIEAAQFLFYATGVRASADLIERDTPETLKLKQALYTQCPPGSEAWTLKAGKISLDFASGRGVARDTSVRIKGVPVFYTPWLDFPIDDRRSTGLLWPGFASSDGGLDVSVPYYFNLAPNYDLTLTPRFLEQRGGMLETELRYLNRWSAWQVSSAYLDDDRQADRNRWLLAITEQGNFNDRWSTQIDFNRVSDQDYFTDLSVASLAVKRSTHLDQRAQLDYQSTRWRSQLNVHQYQTLADLSEPYRKVPQWTLEYLPVARNLRPQPLLRADITDFDHKRRLEQGGVFITGLRQYVEAGVRLPWVGRAGQLVTTAKARHLNYQLDDGVIDESPEVTAALASVDASLVFERHGERWRQTLEPRLFYLYSDYEPGQENQPVFDTTLLPFSYQQLFRESRFAGYDRIDDSRQLSVGLSARFFDHNSGRERLNLAIGQAFYQADRRVTLPDTVVAGTLTIDPALLDSSVTIPGTNTIQQPAGSAGSSEQRRENSSDIATELNWQVADDHWLRADMVVDRGDGRVNQGHLGWHYRSGPRTLYNFGYSQRRLTVIEADDRPELQQLDASLSLPLGLQWQLFGRWHYDLEDKRSLENLVGIAYESCCWTVRALYQRALEPDDSSLSNDLEYDEAILLEFQLKGLGGLGDKLTNILEESIFGYRDD